MAFLCCVEVGKVKFNEVLHTKGNGTMKVTFPKICGKAVAFFFVLMNQAVE